MAAEQIMKRWIGKDVQVTPLKKLRVGDTVRVRGYNGEAQIERLYNDIDGGIRLASTLGGFFSWNEQDVDLVKRLTDP